MLKAPVYWTAKHIRTEYDISTETLRRWDKQGKIETLQQPGQRRLYSIESVRKHIGYTPTALTEEKTQNRQGALYARVSSQKQKEAGDLQRQIDTLQRAYPSYQVFQDVGSGLNFKRPGLSALLERVHEGTISTVVVLYKDRLCRYGYELLEFLFEKATVSLVVLHTEETGADALTREQELAQDLIAITNVFVARHNGQRSAENRKRRKREREQEKQRGVDDDPEREQTATEDTSGARTSA